MALLIVGTLIGCANEGLTHKEGVTTATGCSDEYTYGSAIVEIGSGTGESFTAGTLYIASPSLAAGGATTITASSSLTVA